MRLKRLAVDLWGKVTWISAITHVISVSVALSRPLHRPCNAETQIAVKVCRVRISCRSHSVSFPATCGLAHERMNRKCKWLLLYMLHVCDQEGGGLLEIILSLKSVCCTACDMGKIFTCIHLQWEREIVLWNSDIINSFQKSKWMQIVIPKWLFRYKIINRW